MDELERLRREAFGDEGYEKWITEEKILEKRIALSLKAGELESKGEVDKAIKLYELLAAENFRYPTPYSRLAIIYRKRKQYGEEMRILEKGIWIFEKVVPKSMGGRELMIEKYRKRLEKAKAMMAKDQL